MIDLFVVLVLVYNVLELLFANNLFVETVRELLFVKYFFALKFTCHKFLFCSAGIVRPFWRGVRDMDLRSA